MRKTTWTTWAGILGWIIAFLATLLFIYIAARVVKNPSSPSMTELTLFIVSVVFEGVGIFLLMIWLGIL